MATAIADADPPRHPEQHLAPGHRLKQGLDRRDDQARRHASRPGGRRRGAACQRPRRSRPARGAASPRPGKTSGVIPEKTATSSRKSSTSPMWARTMTSVVGACNPSAAVTRPAAEPQAPSIVAARPFLRAASASGKPARALDLPGQVLELGSRGNGGRGG